MAAADRESQTAADMAAAAEEEEQKGQQERERDPADEYVEEALRNSHWAHPKVYEWDQKWWEDIDGDGSVMKTN